MWWKTRKRIRDRRTVRRYRQRLRAERKIYTQTAEAYSDTDRKSRALAAGECCLKALEAVGALNLQHALIPGTLEYIIDQQKVQDDTGRKGFRYQVTYAVKADEPAFTEEQIDEKCRELAGKLKLETEELFAKEQAEDEDDAGEDVEQAAEGERQTDQ